jgi:hypothetical protein
MLIRRTVQLGSVFACLAYEPNSLHSAQKPNQNVAFFGIITFPVVWIIVQKMPNWTRYVEVVSIRRPI